MGWGAESPALGFPLWALGLALRSPFLGCCGVSSLYPRPLRLVPMPHVYLSHQPLLLLPSPPQGLLFPSLPSLALTQFSLCLLSIGFLLLTLSSAVYPPPRLSPGAALPTTLSLCPPFPGVRGQPPPQPSPHASSPSLMVSFSHTCCHTPGVCSVSPPRSPCPCPPSLSRPCSTPTAGEARAVTNGGGTAASPRWWYFYPVSEQTVL